MLNLCYDKLRNMDINEFVKRNLDVFIFIFFFCIYIILGLIISYNTSVVYNYDFLFGTDSPRVIDDMTNICGNHYRASVHPLFVIIVQPICIFVNLFIKNKILTSIFVSSIVGAINVILLRKILIKLNVNNKINILLICIYGLSFSSIFFSSILETYIFAAFFLLLAWLYALNIKNKKIGYKEYIILILLGIFNYGITITNICQYLVILGYLFLNKNDRCLVGFLKIIFLFIIITCCMGTLSYIQYLVWPNVPLVTSVIETNSESEYIDLNISLDKIKNVIVTFFGYSFISSDFKISNIYVDVDVLIHADYNTFFKLLFIILLIIYFIFNIIYIFNKKNERNSVYYFLHISLIGNLILHCMYGVHETFLYSQHIVFLIVIIIGLITKFEKKSLKNAYENGLLVYLIFEIIFNTIAIANILNVIKEKYMCNFDFLNDFTFFILSLICVLFTLVIIKVLKNRKIKIDNIICIIIIIIYIIILGYVYFTKNLYIKLKNNYKDEFIKYNEYKKEISILEKNHNINYININGKNNYYFFGMANREKYVYINGKLKNILSEEIKHDFKPVYEIIIPNIYTVIGIDLFGNTFKIYENEEGIFIEDKDGLNVIEDKYEKLYNFNNQKYQNIKKVLYSEILFNIKDGLPYPNIMVYDNAWYRDAAYIGMALKNTDNLELIKDFILNIDNIYDLQNNGEKEADNLGEVLYLISLVSDKDNTIVQKILNEVKKITIEKDNKKYIVGNTDYGKKPAYQTSFLKLGLKKLCIENEYSLDGLDDEYLNMVWWDKEENSKELENNLIYDFNYPYLSISRYHKLNKGMLGINNTLYPLSYERLASCANYNNMKKIDNYFYENKISPTHGWTASEILLFMLDEEGILEI